MHTSYNMLPASHLDLDSYLHNLSTVFNRLLFLASDSDSDRDLDWEAYDISHWEAYDKEWDECDRPQDALWVDAVIYMSHKSGDNGCTACMCLELVETISLAFFEKN